MSDFDEQALYKLLFDDDYEFDPEDDVEDPDYEDVFEEHEEDEFDAEDVSDEQQASSSSDQFIGKDGTIWKYDPIIKPGRSLRFTQKIYVPKPDREAKNASTPLDFWKLLLNDNIMKIVHQHTAKEIADRKEERERLKKPHESYHRETSIDELHALFGLLYLIGVQKNSKTNVNELWSPKNGITVFRATMSEHRFRFLLACVRFDDRNTRDERKKDDVFTGIREVWSIFIQNCTHNYAPAHNMTIDEQLMSFRGNCPFRRYMPQKPAKYGMKVVMLNDASTSYMYNAIPEVNRSETEKEKVAKEKEEKKREREESKTRSKSVERKKQKMAEGKGKKGEARSKSKEKKKPKTEQEKEKERKEKLEEKRLENLRKEYVASKFVRELCLPIQNTTRNITVDNWFSSVPLFNEMLQENKISMVGTVRSKLPQVPNYFKQKHKPGTSLFAFDDTKVLVSYTTTTKDPKVVLLMSTLSNLYNKDISSETKKPNIIMFYNSTKGGTDTFDQLCSNYTTARKSNRWTVRFFYGILDMAGINSMILYSLSERNKSKERKLTRRKYLWSLGLELIEPHLRMRVQHPNVHTKLKTAIRTILNIDDTSSVSSEPSPGSGVGPPQMKTKTRCYICAELKRKRYKVGDCGTCGRPYCKEHQAKVCEREDCKEK